ncbi:MAG: ATPase domain-containing protein [Nitrososphaerales archaeon]
MASEAKETEPFPEVGSGLSSIDDLLGGKGYPDNYSILIEGRSDVEKDLFLHAFIHEGTQLGDFCIYVTRQPVGIVTRAAKISGYDLNGRDIEWIASEDGQLKYSPDDLTRLSLNIKETLRKSQGRRLRVVSDVLSSLLLLNDSETIYRFLSQLLLEGRRYQGVLLATLDEGMTDTRAIAAMEELFDGLLYVSQEGTHSLRVKQGKMQTLPRDSRSRESSVIQLAVQVPEKSAALGLNEHRIAVLPFRNISPDPSDEYFAEGLTEELISTFSKITQLKVISRTSVMRYRQTEKSLSEIAEDLKVKTVLEGSVRKLGNDLRITAQLINVESDEHLWSLDYDRKFENVFALQKEIAQRVANSLKVTILSHENSEMGKKSTKDMDAYTLYLKGRSYRHRITLDSFRKTIEYCERAIEKDSNFARAYAEIAVSYAVMGYWEFLPSKEVFPKAKLYAQKAIQLDDTIPQSHLALGLVNWLYKWSFPRADAEYRRALELNPSYAEAHLTRSFTLANVGRFAEAVTECTQALELDPQSAWTRLYGGATLYICSEFDDATRILNEALKLDPNLSLAHDILGCISALSGSYEIGISQLKKAMELGGGMIVKSDLAQAYSMSGDEDKAREILAEMIRLKEQGENSEVAIGGIYLSLGDLDSALLWLERAYENHVSYLLAVYCDPFYRKLRPDPRFQALWRKVVS